MSLSTENPQSSADTGRSARSSRSAIIFDLLGTAMIAVTVTALMLIAYDSLRYRPVLAVDVERIMSQKLDALQQQLRTTPSAQIDKQALVQQSRRWAQQLSAEVQRLARDHNAVVLTRPAVIEGAVDMTEPVLNAINRQQP